MSYAPTVPSFPLRNALQDCNYWFKHLSFPLEDNLHEINNLTCLVVFSSCNAESAQSKLSINICCMHKSFKENRKPEKLSHLPAPGSDPCVSEDIVRLFLHFTAAQWNGPCGQEGSFILFPILFLRNSILNLVLNIEKSSVLYHNRTYILKYCFENSGCLVIYLCVLNKLYNL